MAVTLIIPADAASIRLARLVATGYASQLNATVADLDDPVRAVLTDRAVELLRLAAVAGPCGAPVAGAVPQRSQ